MKDLSYHDILKGFDGTTQIGIESDLERQGIDLMVPLAFLLSHTPEEIKAVFDKTPISEARGRTLHRRKKRKLP